jgi:abortive infection bacteriophage resistance protein
MAGTDWKSFADQLQILKDRGLGVGDDARAISYLEKIGYYCLSGYWYPFRVPKAKPVGLVFREDNFLPGSTFEDAASLYAFDRKLRLLALDALERIERALRVDVAHCLGKIDCFAQYEPALLHGNFARRPIQRGANAGKTEHALWLNHQHKLISRSRKQHFVAHNLAKHGRLPIWVAIEIWDFGALSRLFAGMNVKDRDLIAASYGLATGRELEQWLRSLSYLRNVAAHHSRMWNVNVLELSPVPQFDRHWRALHNARPFMYFCIMQWLLLRISPKSSWKTKFKDLMAEFPEPANKAVTAIDFGLLQGWESWPLWA